MPRYRDAVFGDETVVLENRHVRLELFKRRTGWGWGELSVPDGKGGMRFFAVLEHLGELDAEGLPHPLRLEAPGYTLSQDGGKQELRFEVQTQEVEPPDKTFGGESPVKGTVVLTLASDDWVVGYRMEVTAQFLFRLKYLRGAWLRVGADGFGVAKDDAIFPGIEWLEGQEWSSGTNWFDHPERLRLTPHPQKVSFPCMAISQGGMGLGLWYEPDTLATTAPPAYPQALVRFPQPVFASPNFIDCRNDHIMGLMWPSVRQGLNENTLSANPALKASPGLRLVLAAEIAVVAGRSLDVVVAWVKRKGLPEPGLPRWPWKTVYDKTLHALDTNLFREGKGFAPSAFDRGEGVPVVPPIVRQYIAEGLDRVLAESLKRKAEWCDAQPRPPQSEQNNPAARPFIIAMNEPERIIEVAEIMLAIQTPEGDFPFDPEGRHKTDLASIAAYWRPLGQAGDSAVDLVAAAAMVLMMGYEKTGRQDLNTAAHKALEFAMRFLRPEGGDWWETPFKSPNLLATGDAAIAYYKGFQLFGDERYRQKAIWWIRGVLPFTHLWQPQDLPMLYNTKPCLNSTSWFLSDWVSHCVQWEVLQVFLYSHTLGIDWAAIDPEIDWKTYHRGVCTAVLRWVIDHNDKEWMFRSEFPVEWTANGSFDMEWTDTFDPVKGSYGGGPISPAWQIAQSALIMIAQGY
ncbi:MAG: hypothetical protein ACYCZF_05615 [Anaerolineae bacterium]